MIDKEGFLESIYTSFTLSYILIIYLASTMTFTVGSICFCIFSNNYFVWEFLIKYECIIFHPTSAAGRIQDVFVSRTAPMFFINRNTINTFGFSGLDY